MKTIDLPELKKIELKVLTQIHNICTAQGFRYFLVGGTLLGAVRHQGFIPWDDDIDIGMPRPDYEKFIEYCSANDVPFTLLCNKTDSRYGYLFAKAMDKNTVLVETLGNKYNIDMGVFVDIFPIDGLGDTVEEAVSALNKTRFDRELLVAANWKRFVRSKTRAWYYEPIRFAFYCLSRIVSFEKTIQRIEAKYKKDDFDQKKYVGCICSLYRNKSIVDQEIYTECVDLPFEDGIFKCSKQYDRYLSAIYGDYMQPPPENERVTHHSFEAYYK